MLLVLGSSEERSINDVLLRCNLRKIKWFRLNGEDFPYGTTIKFNPVTGACHLVDHHGCKVDLNEITSVWYRRRGSPKISKELSQGERDFISKEFAATINAIYYRLSNRFWANDFLAENRAQNKCEQLYVAKKSGLRCPKSLITTIPDQARDFSRKFARVITKAINQSGIIREEGTEPSLIYTNVVTREMMEKVDDVRHAPTLFQEYIEKEIELRVTIVGESLFAVAIDSQASEKTSIDWRHYDLENTPHYPYKLPDEVQSQLLLFMRSLNLQFGAIDLIKERDTGHYYFLECNSGGQWGWIEQLSGFPITERLVDLFEEATS